MPRRWSDLDTDTHRLPSGFTRIGYDSNTRRYQFRDGEGRTYQGEPGEEFGGHLTPMKAIDASMRHRFATDEDEVGDVEENAISGPPNPEAGSPRLVFTPTGQTIPNSPSSFSDFLSSTQIAAATPPKPPQKKPSNHGSAFSLRRVTTSILGFRSAKSKNKPATLPNFASPGMDEWGVVQSPQSAKF